MACKAVRTIKAALKPPSSGRKLAKLTKVSQPTLNQLANEIHTASPATKKKLKKSLGIEDGDWE
jgi:plasmid maintenance system antidote protein VapI